METFLISINNISAIMAITYGVSILVNNVRLSFHNCLAVLLCMLGLSYFARAYAVQSFDHNYEVFAHVGLVAVMMGLVVCFFVFRFVDHKFLNRRDQSVLRLLFYGAVCSFVVYVFNGLYKLNIVSFDVSQLSSLLSLQVVFHLSRHYGSVDMLNLREELKIVGQCLLFSIVSTGFLFLSGVFIYSAEQLAAIILILYACSIFAVFLFRQVLAGDRSNILEALGKLSLVPVHNLPQYIRDLSRSGFFGGMEVMRESGVEYHRLEAAYRVLRTGVTYNHQMVQQKLKDPHTPLLQVRAYIAIYKLLELKEAQALVLLGPRQEIIFFRQEPLSSAHVFYALINSIAQTVPLLHHVEEDTAKLIAVNFDAHP